MLMLGTRRGQRRNEAGLQRLAGRDMEQGRDGLGQVLIRWWRDLLWARRRGLLLGRGVLLPGGHGSGVCTAVAADTRPEAHPRLGSVRRRTRLHLEVM